jgi:probable HAF family extracellular repeat protein
MGDAGNARNRFRATMWRPDGTEVRLDPGFPYVEARAVALNDDGIVAGEVTVQVGVEEGLPDLDVFVVRWSVDEEGARVVDSIRIGAGSPAAINARGQVVGTSAGAWIWDPGAEAVRYLQVPGAIHSSAAALNDRGDVVGSAALGLGGPLRAVRWDAATGGATLLPDLGGTSARAVAVNESGVVAGQATRPDGVPHAFRVDPGSATAVDLGGDSTVSSVAVSVAATGSVHGVEDGRAVVRWDPDAPDAG